MTSQWKRMSSGKYIDLANFSPEDVDIRDIETALNRLTRFTGHGEYPPLTIAQHSILCRRLCAIDHPVNYNLQLAVFVHDAAEAYFGDVATPVKKSLGKAWYDFATPIEDAVNTALLGYIPDEIEHAAIKYYDAMALDIERRVIWSSQRGKDKWPEFNSRMTLEDKAALFYETKNLGDIPFHDTYHSLREWSQEYNKE